MGIRKIYFTEDYRRNEMYDGVLPSGSDSEQSELYLREQIS